MKSTFILLACCTLIAIAYSLPVNDLSSSEEESSPKLSPSKWELEVKEHPISQIGCFDSTCKSEDDDDDNSDPSSFEEIDVKSKRSIEDISNSESNSKSSEEDNKTVRPKREYL